jgi:glutathione S-transferase
MCTVLLCVLLCLQMLSEQEFIQGKEFSVADVAVASTL